jgi:hypothetical protein
MSKKPETFMLIVQKGGLVPADRFTQERLRAKSYHNGDVLSATLRKARNPAFHRLSHAFGKLCSDNIERFRDTGAHQVLKLVQYEGDIACERMMVNLKGFGMVEVRVPRSLSFESMDEGEFTEVFRAMCKHVSDTYWQDCTPEQIEEMASAMPEAA